VINIHGNFEVFNFNDSQYIEGSQNMKVGHVTSLGPPLTQFCTFSLQPLYMCTKFEVSFATYGGGPKISKVGHVTLPDPL